MPQSKNKLYNKIKENTFYIKKKLIMKRLIFAVLAVMVMAVPMANAQKVNKSAIEAKLEKADAAVADAKKATKAATWIARGKAYYEAANVATKDLFVGMSMDDMQLYLGEPIEGHPNVVVNNAVCNEWVYPWVKVYTNEHHRVVSWVTTQNIRDDKELGKVALESFNKAFELDNNVGKKLGEDMNNLANFYKVRGNVATDFKEYLAAASDYLTAYNVQKSPAYAGEKNHDLPYIAGYLYTVDGQTNPESLEKGIAALSEALAAGYADEKGDIYNYLYLCYYLQKDSPVRAANLERAKQVLMEGLAKFPNNDSIVEGLINIYTDSEANVGNPADLIEMVDKALERDPKNSGLWYGRGRIFYSLQDFDQAIESFKKVVEIAPEDAYTWYYIGYFYVNKADAMNEEFNKRDIKSIKEWDEGQASILAVYNEALPYMEKAYEMKPEFSFVETLKALTFRLRDQEGMMEKYEKYNAIYKELKDKQ